MEEKILKVTAGKVKQDQQFVDLQKDGFNVQEIIKEINERTSIIPGVEVKVVLKIDKNKKTWEIEDIEWPKVTELLRLLTNFSVKRQNKKGITIFAQKPGEEIVGDISFENVVKIAKAKINEMNTNSLKSAVKSVLGTCLSVGITVDGKHPKEVTKEVNEGKYDSMIQ
jgi:large subunit ribosomal protein L11